MLGGFGCLFGGLISLSCGLVWSVGSFVWLFGGLLTLIISFAGLVAPLTLDTFADEEAELVLRQLAAGAAPGIEAQPFGSLLGSSTALAASVTSRFYYTINFIWISAVRDKFIEGF